MVELRGRGETIIHYEIDGKINKYADHCRDEFFGRVAARMPGITAEQVATVHALNGGMLSDMTIDIIGSPITKEQHNKIKMLIDCSKTLTASEQQYQNLQHLKAALPQFTADFKTAFARLITTSHMTGEALDKAEIYAEALTMDAIHMCFPEFKKARSVEGLENEDMQWFYRIDNNKHRQDLTRLLFEYANTDTETISLAISKFSKEIGQALRMHSQLGQTVSAPER